MLSESKYEPVNVFWGTAVKEEVESEKDRFAVLDILCQASGRTPFKQHQECCQTVMAGDRMIGKNLKDIVTGK